jgi:hypothetical protein
MHLFERWGNMNLRPSTGSITEAQAAVIPQLIGVNEQSTGLNYRILTNYNNTAVPSFALRFGASYVTGSHAFKVGWNNTSGYLHENNYVLNPLSYRFNNGVPNRITERTNYIAKTNLDADMGFYAQDRWTVNRLTLQGAIRFDLFRTSFPDQTLGPDELTPNRNLNFPGAKNINWKDVTYRSGFTYDLLGNGKTALKVAFNKYLLGQTLNGIGRSPNPVLAAVTSANRGWNDANGDYIPQCDLTLLSANGECGALDNQLFGSAVAGSLFDPDLIGGFNHRTTNWEFTASVQHELLPRVALDVGFFRRAWANQQVTDNLLVSASDFTPFNITVPTDSRLTDGGGYTLTGFVDVNPALFGQVQNYVSLDSKYGGQKEHYNGVDINVNARLQNGLNFQGGVSTGKTMTDNCNVIAALPEMQNQGNAGWRSAQYCHTDTPWLTSVKMFGTYTLPKVDVQISGTFRNVDGNSINAIFTANNAYLAANSTLGRPLAGSSSARVNLQLLDPVVKYLDRRNELDLRFGKVIRFGQARSVVSWDMFNALNNDAVLTANTAFASFLRPTSILNARVMKLSIAFDF